MGSACLKGLKCQIRDLLEIVILINGELGPWINILAMTGEHIKVMSSPYCRLRWACASA